MTPIVRYRNRLGSTLLVLVAAVVLLGPLAAERVLAQTPTAQMPPAMAKAYVMGIQEKLQQKGYKPGPLDGTVGPRTTEAIRAYQRAAGLPVDGVPTDALLDHLTFVEPAAAVSSASKRRTTGPSPFIREVQQALKLRGYDPGPVDGVSGHRTRAAVRRFQQDYNLSPTGEVDERVLRLLKQGS